MQRRAWFRLGGALALGVLLALSAAPGRANPPPGRFSVAAGIVTDSATALQWQRNDDGSGRAYENAGPYCDGLTLGGFTDWRLPTITELDTLIDESRASNVIDPDAFPGGNVVTWSSSLTNNPKYQLGIDFASDGSTGNYETRFTYIHARCVR